MKNTVDSDQPVKLNSNPIPGPSCYRISIEFPDTSTSNTRLTVFDDIKKSGTFNIRNMNNHIYILDFKSVLTRDGVKERLKELAGPGALFNYTIEDVLQF
jgi:hypothetical protein